MCVYAMGRHLNIRYVQSNSTLQSERGRMHNSPIFHNSPFVVYSFLDLHTITNNSILTFHPLVYSIICCRQIYIKQAYYEVFD